MSEPGNLGSGPPTEFESVSPATDWQHLRPYLPDSVYQLIEAAPADKKSQLCLAPLRRLLRVVISYVPRQVALRLLREPTRPEQQAGGQFMEGTLLFADISGFTSLSERLRQEGGKEGAEETVRVINEYFTLMLDAVYKYDGQLIKFGGDAMFCMFAGKEAAALHAVWAAREMKQAVESHQAYSQILEDNVSLRIKFGINSGSFLAATVGMETHMEYVLTGDAVSHTARAESAANVGDIIISQECFELISSHMQANPVPEAAGFFQVGEFLSPPVPPGDDTWERIELSLARFENDVWQISQRLDALTPYLLPGILPQLVYAPEEEQVEGEHRQVTVLFANLKGMDSIIHTYGEKEALRIAQLLNEYFVTVQQIIIEQGGVINKIDLYHEGDKLMALFGAPVAFARAAERAATAALAMQKAMNSLPRPAASQLAQHIGINTGLVFACNVGSARNRRREYTVIGDNVNLAARLMSLSEKRQILISQSTWDQVQARFQADPLPVTYVKGKQEPVQPYLLQAEIEKEGVKELRRIASRMVGRDAEFKLLQDRFLRLQEERRKQIVAITGAEGIGKTRLTTEWQLWAESHPWPIRWLAARERSYGRKAYQSFISIVEQLVGISDDDDSQGRWHKLSTRLRQVLEETDERRFNPEQFENRLAYLGEFLGFDLSQKDDLMERTTEIDAQSLQLQIRLALLDLMKHAARDQILVCQLGDLHWADAETLELLRYLWQQIETETRIFFCINFRWQRESTIWEKWQELERILPENSLLIRLDRLDGQQHREFLSNLLGTDQIPSEFENMILNSADGNPLFMEEILLSLITQKVLEHDGEQWRITQNLKELALPDTLQQIIQSRFDELSEASKRVLYMAAVIGSEFDERSVLHLFANTGRAESEFRRAIDELKGADIVQMRSSGDDLPSQWTYSFRHGLLQSVAYQTMNLQSQRTYHNEIGSWIEQTYAHELVRQYPLLANHYHKGQRWEKAFQYHWLAGQQEARSYANENALNQLRQALDTANRAGVDQEELAEVHFELGKVQAIRGEFGQGIETLETAHLLFSRREEPSALQIAQVCYQAGRIYDQQGGAENLNQALVWQEKGLAALPASPTPEAAMLRALGSIIRLRQGDMDRAVEEGEQSLSLAQAAGARTELAYAHRMLSVLRHAQGDLPQAMEHCQQSILIGEELSDLMSLAKDYSNRGVYAFEMDDWPLAEASYLRAGEILQRVGDRFELGRNYLNLGDLYSHQGEIEKGIRVTQQSLDIFGELEAMTGIIVARSVMATLFLRVGKLAESEAELLEAKALAEEMVQFQPMVSRWLAEVYVEAGDIDKAEAEVNWLLTQTSSLDEYEVEPIQRLWGLILAHRDKLDEARQVLNDSLTRLQQKGAQYLMGSLLLALAYVESQRMDDADHLDNARKYAESGRRVLEQLGARMDVKKADSFIGKL